jgi:hypothetical protein
MDPPDAIGVQDRIGSLMEDHDICVAGFVVFLLASIERWFLLIPIRQLSEDFR